MTWGQLGRAPAGRGLAKSPTPKDLESYRSFRTQTDLTVYGEPVGAGEPENTGSHRGQAQILDWFDGEPQRAGERRPAVKRANRRNSGMAGKGQSGLRSDWPP